MAQVFIKTTVELPENLMKQVKLRSVLRNEKLKDTLADVIDLGLKEEPKPKRRPASLKPINGGQFSSEEIDRWVEEGRR